MENFSVFVLRIRVLKIMKKCAAPAGVLLLLTSCAQLGPDLVRAGRND